MAAVSSTPLATPGAFPQRRGFDKLSPKGVVGLLSVIANQDDS
jgi:hypothetical protein